MRKKRIAVKDKHMQRDKQMQRILFTNVMIWTNGDVVAGQVLIEGNLIKAVAKSGEIGASALSATLVDGGGATLMPGLIDGHAHIAFPDMPDYKQWGSIPVEEHVLIYMHNARAVLDGGITGAISAGAVKPRLDIVIRNEINAGRIPGPRMLACTPELTCTGGLGDDRRMHLDIQTMSLMADGPDEFRRIARLFCREGVDLLKVAVSGHPTMAHAPAQATVMTEDEIAAVVDTAKMFGKQTAAHARSNESVQMCLRRGVDILYHCEYANAATLDDIEAARDRVFLGPAIGPIHAMLFEDSVPKIAAAARGELERQFEQYCKTYTALRKRGVKVLIGGEYGLPGIPHGYTSRDLAHFVNYFGYSGSEALIAATRHAAEAMRMGDRLGQIEPGFLADLLLVRGRPWEDVTLMSDHANLLAVMSNGVFHKHPLAPSRESSDIAAYA